MLWNFHTADSSLSQLKCYQEWPTIELINICYHSLIARNIKSWACICHTTFHVAKNFQTFIIMTIKGFNQFIAGVKQIFFGNFTEFYICMFCIWAMIMPIWLQFSSRKWNAVFVWSLKGLLICIRNIFFGEPLLFANLTFPQNT